MPLIHQRQPGRRLMVLDDAETIARQARRRAVMRRKRREATQGVAVFTLIVGLVAVLMGSAWVNVGLIVLASWALLAFGYQWLRTRQRQVVRRRRRAVPGAGIGTPRPKGGFSTTRHRSGAPVWINDRAA